MDSRVATYEHIQTVQRILAAVIADLQKRQIVHDQSKLVSPEVEIFDEYTEKLKTSTYGSDEYKSFLAGMKPALDHHYAANSHHPEHGFSSEVWKPVVGYEESYEVSSFGRVKGVSKGDMLSLQPTPKGYLRVSLYHKDGAKNFMVHRLVASAFLENKELKPQVNHLDGNKQNNEVSNLEWCTQSENQLHAYDLGLKESNVKYFVHCLELDIWSCGTLQMERQLRERGYERASSAGIYNAMDGSQKHLDLTFESYLISEGHPISMVRGMSLLDLIEMLCDWKAATLRHNDGDIRRSIEINQKRFGYSDELKQIFINTLGLIDNGK